MQPKMKSDNYENFGGVNTKASAYLTGPREALAIFNYDFSSIGDLTGRPGTTQYLSATFGSSAFTGLYEYTKTSGYSKIIASNPGQMWLVQDNTRAGISLGDLAATQNIAFLSNRNSYIWPATFGSSDYDFTTFVDHVFFCDGRSFLKYNGSTITFFSNPRPPIDGAVSFTAAVGGGGAVTLGYYYYRYSYLNLRGHVGPGKILSPSDGAQITGVSKVITIDAGSVFRYAGFGITALYIYKAYSQSTAPTSDADYFLHKIAGWSDGIIIDNSSGGDLSEDGELMSNYVVPWEGASYSGGFLSHLLYQYAVQAPKFIEVYKNQMFMGGFTLTPSTVWFSDVGDPEGIDPDFNFEVRTDDGDRVTNLQSYGNRLLIFKELSFHELLGDSPENFSLREVSLQYGCINNKTSCVWSDRCWFLDRKGICEYTGGIPSVVSNKIDNIFDRMNLSVARQTAEMRFMKNRNEVWISIPVDGSSVNNLLLIYDINIEAWAFWDGINIAVMAKMIGRNSSETSFFGDYQNRLNTFGSSLMGDNGSGFTSMVKFRYEHPEGQSVEKIFRRLFVNAESVTSRATLPIETRLRANYGSSYQVAASLVLTKFQNYENFGISSKSLSVEISHFSATDSMRLHGYALEHRFQRNT